MSTPPRSPEADRFPPEPDVLDVLGDDGFPPGFPSNSERNWAVFCHLGGFAIYLLPFAFGQILVPLLLWLVKRNDSAFVDEHGREALNFQITFTLYAFVAGILVLAWIGWILLVALAVAQAVLMIVASVHASQGEPYRYPFTLRLI
jgi:uncharacterized Tic20 family protein